MSETPRTDAAQFAHIVDDGGAWLVESEFARTLERENNELRAALLKIQQTTLCFGAEERAAAALQERRLA